MSTTVAAGYDLVLFDLDGVVYVGEQPVPHAPEAIRSIVESGTPVAYVTNNASRSRDDVVALLRSIGVPGGPQDVLTSARAAAALLAAELPPGAAVLVVGAPALRDEIGAVGLEPVTQAANCPVAVVQGYGPQVGWHDLAEASVAIRSGARWVATNTDATLPSPRGPLPGNGSLVAALSTALSGHAPDLVVGKPSAAIFELVARERGARRVLVVGDRLDTDIEGARRAGMDSLLVLTGVTDAAGVLAAPAHARPTFIGADCRALSITDDRVRVPSFDAADQAVQVGGWLVTHVAAQLVLRWTGSDAVGGRNAVGGDGTVRDVVNGARITRADGSADAVRALAAGAWAHPAWAMIVAGDAAAARTIEDLGLSHGEAATMDRPVADPHPARP